jgi:hypothetical protein
MDRLGAMMESVRTEIAHEDDALVRAQAERFLRTLDAASQLGMWFDALAESYPSRLDAAMAYVRDVLTESNTDRSVATAHCPGPRPRPRRSS